MKALPWVRWGSAMLLALFLTSCTGQRTYLRGAAGHATQAEVAEHLGPPQATWHLDTGDTLWTYQYGAPRASAWGGITIVGPGLTFGKGSPCSEYVLRFDQDDILHTWRRQECKPDSP